MLRGERRKPEAEEYRPPLKVLVGTAARLTRFLSPWRRALTGLIATGILSVGCDLAIPLAVERCIDAIGFSRGAWVDMVELKKGAAAFVGLFLLSAALEYVQGLLNAELVVNVEKSLRGELYGKILRLPVERLDRMRQGDLISRVFNDTRLAANAFPDAVVSLLCSVLVIVGSGAIMFWKCPELAAIATVAAAASAALTWFVSGMLLPRFRAQQEALGEVTAHASECLSTFRSAVEGGRLDWDLARMKEKDRAYYTARMRVCWIEGLIKPLMLLLGNGAFLLLVVCGARLAITHRITLGVVQAFVLYFRQFMEPVNGLGECWVQVNSALSGAGRIFEILDIESEDSTTGLPAGGGERKAGELLCLDRVRFGYRRNLPVLKGLSLRVRKDQRVAIVGKTGVGKTTIFQLLERFYQRYDGSITLEGRELRKIPLDELRRRITIIPQEPQLLSGTVYDNIAYGAQGATEEDVRRAAEKVGAADFIEAQPEGYRTMLSADRTVFSQGQLQLLCLARACLRECSILLLDEASSSLDTATESRLQEALETMMAGRTCVTIAHRLSTITRSDVICVLEDGQLCESGTHRELMERKGAYYDLFMSQYWGKEI